MRASNRRPETCPTVVLGQGAAEAPNDASGGQPAALPNELDRLRRQIKRMRREMKALHASMESGFDLVLETFVQHPAPQTWTPGQAVVHAKPGPMPLVAIAGVRGDQRRAIEDAVGDRVEIIWVDPGKTSPSEIGPIDRLFFMRFCGEKWGRQAIKEYSGRWERMSGTSAIISSILTMCS